MIDERDGASNYQLLECLLNPLFRRRSKKTSKLRVNGLCEGNPPDTGRFPSQRASDVENTSIWWRHHDILLKIENNKSMSRGDTVGLSPRWWGCISVTVMKQIAKQLIDKINIATREDVY